MNAHLRSAGGGFTLIEMIITLCVFVMLAASVFGIFSATLESAGALRDNQNRQDQVEALAAWLEQSFLAMPANGTLVSYHRDGRPFRVSGIIWGSGSDLQALDLQMQANGNYTLRLATYALADSSSPGDQASNVTATAGYSPALARFQTQVFNDDAALTWRPLVRDLKSADWRFRTLNSTDWQDTFSNGKPVLTELTFQPAGTSSAIVDDFWIPPTTLPVGLVVAPAASLTTNP
jgi:prepilin-type N-terminal cleavage/methylation domain-containing protein